MAESRSWLVAPSGSTSGEPAPRPSRRVGLTRRGRKPYRPNEVVAGWRRADRAKASKALTRRGEAARGACADRSGASNSHATCVATHVVDAELAGHPSHGLRLVPRYCELAGTDGPASSTSSPVVVDVRGALSIVDAGGGIGYPALEVAVDVSSDERDSSGRHRRVLGNPLWPCRVGQGHGPSAQWANGVVAIVLLGGAEPPFVMAAGPGSVASLHTNPIAIGVPADGPSLILDMATSLVAEGKVAIAALTRHASPRGRDREPGRDITIDPAEYYEEARCSRSPATKVSGSPRWWRRSPLA